MLACQGRNCVTRETFVGRHRIDFRAINSLRQRFGELRFSQRPGSYRMSIEEKISDNLVIHLGSNLIETDIPTSVEKVMIRDYVKEFQAARICIFVPKVRVLLFLVFITHFL